MKQTIYRVIKMGEIIAIHNVRQIINLLVTLRCALVVKRYFLQFKTKGEFTVFICLSMTFGQTSFILQHVFKIQLKVGV